MTTGRRGLILAAGATGLLTGCVDRRFVVETNVPGAQVYVDGNPVGPSPADGRWEYAGYYKFTAVAPGYEPLTQMVRFRPKVYQYPPLDLAAEILWPFRIEDVRRVPLTLVPARPVNQLELIGAADTLRAKAATLPPTTVPPDPKRPPNARPQPPAGPQQAQPSLQSAPQTLPLNFEPGGDPGAAGLPAQNRPNLGATTPVPRVFPPGADPRSPGGGVPGQPNPGAFPGDSQTIPGRSGDGAPSVGP